MKLSELKNNEKAIIVNITCNDELKKRFYSFGIVRGVKLFVETTSLNKNTIEINVDGTCVALRVDEADTIEVKSI